MNLMDSLESKNTSEQNKLVTAGSVVHDICVQDVKYLCTQAIDLEVPIPAQSGGIIPGSCRGELIPIDPNVTANVRLICAEESLKANCLGVDIHLGFQITLVPPNPALCPVMVVNHYADFECTTFRAFPTGEYVSGAALREALKIIDGSCVVTENLSAEILDGQCSRVRITGNLTDKLWKNENLWVLAIAPFTGITVGEEFPEPHKIGHCVPCPGPSTEIETSISQCGACSD